MEAREALADEQAALRRVATIVARRRADRDLRGGLRGSRSRLPP
jgi:hypothetical protein